MFWTLYISAELCFWTNVLTTRSYTHLEQHGIWYLSNWASHIHFVLFFQERTDPTIENLSQHKYKANPTFQPHQSPVVLYIHIPLNLIHAINFEFKSQ